MSSETDPSVTTPTAGGSVQPEPQRSPSCHGRGESGGTVWHLLGSERFFEALSHGVVLFPMEEGSFQVPFF